MYEGKRIINIDETVMRNTDHRKKGWLPRGQHNLTTLNSRLSNINLIAGISSKDEFFYTVNQGKTNSYTLAYFIVKLVKHLD